MPQISCTGCRDSSLKEARRITAQAGHILGIFWPSDNDDNDDGDDDNDYNYDDDDDIIIR